MIKFLKLLIALLLLPLCTAATFSFIDLLRGTHSGLPLLHTWALPAGFLLWVLLFLLLPRPTRTYILGHELTHALWGLLLGARVSKMKVGKHGGEVELSKSNWIISLAPYFFPIYTILLLAGYLTVSLFVRLDRWEPLFLFLIGFTWSFHFTFTLDMLCQRQPDILENGRIFSYTVIYLLNLLGICLWVTVIAPGGWDILKDSTAKHTVRFYRISARHASDTAARAAVFCSDLLQQHGNPKKSN